MNRLPQKMILIPEERYKRLTSPNTLQDSKETTQEVKEVNEVKELPIINSTLNSGIPIEDILKFLPMRKQSRARLIASYFDGSNNLQWNDNKEILYDNKPVVGSSIVDLLYDAVCPKRNGASDWLSENTEPMTNIKLTLFQNCFKQRDV